MQNILLQQKIQTLENEIKELKDLAKKGRKKTSSKSLYGILKDVKISWKEFQEAKEAIFSHSSLHFK